MSKETEMLLFQAVGAEMTLPRGQDAILEALTMFCEYVDRERTNLSVEDFALMVGVGAILFRFQHMEAELFPELTLRHRLDALHRLDTLQ